MANISRDTFYKMKHYVSVRLQQGVPLVDADWNEMEDIRRFELQAFLKWFIGNGVPAGNDGFCIKGIDNVENDFIIKGGDGTPEGAGRCLVEGWDVINESDLNYTHQPLYQNATLAAKWNVDPLLELTAPDESHADLVYLDIWEREVNEQEDPNLVNSAIGVPTCVRFKREWVVRVLENCDLSEVPKTWNVNGNEQEIRKEGHAYYPLARKVGQQIDDLRRTGLNLSNLCNGWVRLPFLPKPVKSIARPEFELKIFHASCDKNGAVGSMEIPIPLGINRINRFRIAGEKNTGGINVYLKRVNLTETDVTENDLLPVPDDRSSINATDNKYFNRTWISTDFTSTSLDPETSALTVLVQALGEADIGFIAVEFMG